jgi:VWFA-related protein
VRVVQDFTTDPAELAAVMDTGVGSKSLSKSSPAAPDSSGAKTAKPTSGSKQPILGILPRDVYDPIHGDTTSDLEAKNFQLRDLVELELRGLDMLAQSLAGIPGRKTILWLTGNFPFDLDNPNSYLSPTSMNQYQIVRPAGGSGRDGIAASPGTPGFQVPTTSLIDSSDLQVLRPLYEQAMQSLARAGVAVYPVDTRGVLVYSPGAEISSADLPTSRAQSSTAAFSDAAIRSSMRTFASNTGGKACFGTNDMSDCLQQAISDSQAYYLLGYYRERQNNKPGWRKFKIEVDQAGAEVLAPDGYFYSTGSPDTKEAQQRDIKSALLSPVNFSGLQFAVSLHPAAQSGKGTLQDLKFDLRIPPTSLTPDPTGNNRMSFAIVCTAGTGKGASVDTVAQNLEGTPKPESMERMTREGVTYSNVLHLPSGPYLLHFVIRDNLNGRIGSVVVPYSVD